MLLPAPNGVIPDNRLKPSAQGKDNIISAKVLIKQDFFLLHPFNSIPKEIIFSKTAITVDIAANNINKKNNEPQIRPPGISLNTFGNV